MPSLPSQIVDFQAARRAIQDVLERKLEAQQLGDQ